MGSEFYFSWEPVFMQWIQAHMGNLAVLFASFCTELGESLVLLVFMGYIYWCYDKECGKYVATNLAVGIVCNTMIKNIFNRRRPYLVHSKITCLRPVKAKADIYDIAAQGFSFPSGHATFSTTVYGSFAVFTKKKFFMGLAILLPFLIGISRIMLGVHYPTDILTGWLLGIVTLAAVSYLQKRIKNKKILYLILVLAGAPGLFYCTSEDYFSGYGLMIGVFASILFEEKYVHFKVTRNAVNSTLRLAGGLLIYIILNKALKMLIAALFSCAGEGALQLLRVCRYAIICFMDFGIYPFFFAILDKRFDDKKVHAV